MASKRFRVLISVVVVIVLIVAAISIIELYHPKPSVKVFTDTSQTVTPDHLDPASGFYEVDVPLYSAIYRGLVEFNGSSNNVVPVIAKSISVQNDQNYTFDLRDYVTFSNGGPVNSTDVWFSLYRTIIMGQGPGVSNYGSILFNETDYGITGIALPWGIIPALESGGYSISGSNLTDNYTIAANILDNILSNFNDNASNARIMSYGNQAVVVNSEYSVTVKSLHVYAYVEQDLAGEGWGTVISPSYVDEHGGVSYNTENSYINLHGAIGTGPYEIKSVGPSFSDIVLEATPNYWATGHSSVPAVAQPAHIPEIVIDYGLSHTDRLEDFDKNTSMISEVGPSSFKSIIDGFYNSAYANSGLVHSIAMTSVFDISMNVHLNYTDNVHFRKALIDSNNYTAQTDIYSNNYNGSPEAYNILGPLSPTYGPNYYNPNNAPLQSMNITRAIQNLTIAGHEENFYVVLPNGTKIGNTSGTDLSSHTFTLTAISPPTSIETSQLSVAISSFSHIGLHFTSTYVTSSTTSDWTSPNTTPQFIDLGWYPDFPDPVGQQLVMLYSYTEGGEFGANNAWVDNSTLNNYFQTLEFQNTTVQTKEMKTIYNITDNISAYIWLPVEFTYFFVQPYVHGFVLNSFQEYFYNMMYISYPSSGTSSSSITFANSISSIYLFSIPVISKVPY